MAAFSKTLAAANLPSHQHGLAWGAAGSGKAIFTVGIAAHGETDIKIRDLGGHGIPPEWTNGTFFVNGAGVERWGVVTGLGDPDHYDFSLYTPTMNHAATLGWDADAKTEPYGAGTAIDFAAATMEQRWFADVIWIMRVF